MKLLFSISLIFLGIEVLVLARSNTENSITKSGILTLLQRKTKTLHSTYESVENDLSHTGNFITVNCGNLSLVGGLQESRCRIFEYKSREYKQLSTLNFNGPFSSLLYFSSDSKLQENVVIAIGSPTYYDLVFGVGGSNCIEYLIMNESFRSNLWKICKDKLPLIVSDYQINLFENKIILTGGYNCQDREYTNQVWQGNITFEDSELRVTWSLLTPMLEKRFNHVAVVIRECLYCLGGEEDEDKEDLRSTECYSFKTGKWTYGQDLPCGLSQAKAVVDRSLKLCLIIGGVRDGVRTSKVSLFDPYDGLSDIEGVIDIDSYNEMSIVLL